MYNPYQVQNGINWVQGENAARAWLITPGATALLMDSETDRFYIKTADVSGMPHMRVFEYHEITSNCGQIRPSNDANSNFITREEWDVLQGKIEALEKRMPKRKGESNEQSIPANEQ